MFHGRGAKILYFQKNESDAHANNNLLTRYDTFKAMDKGMYYVYAYPVIWDKWKKKTSKNNAYLGALI